MAAERNKPRSPADEAAADLVARMSPEQQAAIIQALRGGGLLEPPAPEPVELAPPPDFPALLRVRVDLDASRPAIWRRLEVRGDLTLEQLHAVLQAAMGWTDSHLHRFWPGPEKRLWSGPYLLTDFDEEEGEDGPHEREVRLDQLLRAVGDRLFYSYDFGDDWTHTVTVEAVQPLPEDAPRAVCTGGRNACPPEDVGGIWTHNELVADFRGQGDGTTLAEYRDWLPPDWDPTAFQPEQATLSLSLLELTPEQLQELAETGPPPPPGLTGILGRAPQEVVLELAALSAGLGDEAVQAPDPAPETVARAVRPWRVLLDAAGEEGIPLTAAGWMKPAVVEHLHRELGWETPRLGKGNRESQSVPLLQLRESAQSAGLLRKRKDRLLRTRRGRDATGDDRALWDALVQRAVPDMDDFASDASVLYLLHLAAGWPLRDETMDQVARLLMATGWRLQDGRGITRSVVRTAVLPLWHRLHTFNGGHLLSDTPVDPAVVTAFARQALLAER